MRSWDDSLFETMDAISTILIKIEERLWPGPKPRLPYMGCCAEPSRLRPVNIWNQWLVSLHLNFSSTLERMFERHFRIIISLTMKFCCKGTQLYIVGIGLTALMILMGIDCIFPSVSLASARRMNCECDGGSSEQTQVGVTFFAV